MLAKFTQQKFDPKKSQKISSALLAIFKKRRSIRQFSNSNIDSQIILNAISIASLAPSGANKQPWSFCLISDNKTKKLIKDLAEKEEEIFYKVKAPKKWINDLSSLHTNEKKDFLTQASFLIPIFSRYYESNEQGENNPNYYVKESVGVAAGFLISALHLSGLSVLTYTPSKMKFLNKVLNRPKNEKPFLLLAVGLPGPNAQVPVITKKSLNEILTIYSIEKEA